VPADVLARGVLRAPWPSRDADLLAEDPDWWHVACMDWPRDRWLGYVSGCWKVAGLIAAHVAETGHDQDTLTYPFLMCWRHYVELQLKALITLLEKYHREPVPMPKMHRIDHLWRVTRPLLERAFPGDEKDEDGTRHAQRLLMQLHELDSTSEHFRYQFRKMGPTHLPS
jgi:hypothetical protein